MSDDLTKLAAEIPGILLESAQHLEATSTKLAEVQKTAEALELENRALKLARRMEERGMFSELTYDAKVAQIQRGGLEKVAMMEQSIEFAAGSYSLGDVAGANDGAATSGGTSDPLEAYVLSQQALG